MRRIKFFDDLVGTTINNRFALDRLRDNDYRIGTFVAWDLKSQSAPRSSDADQPPPIPVQVLVRVHLRGANHKEVLPVFSPLTNLRHPNVLSIIDVGKFDDCDEWNQYAYVVTEKLDGSVISNLNPGPNEYSRMIDSFVQICCGLEFIHSHGIIHGALEPRSIFVAEPFSEEAIKLVDIGWNLAQSRVEQRGSEPEFYLNEYYVCPELIKDFELDARCDLYSLGCLMYTLLSGAPPFYSENGDTIRVMFQHVTEVPPDVASVNRYANVPKAISAVTMKLLEKEPDDRYQSASELKAAILEAYQSDAGSGS